ncbi:hypothetical protein TBS_35420 [Thermobispora bispora]|uniref:Uncharacterized protein n=1 Tax=Thermobispora bispora (strain ATCC 19993 / DSM 43833 / CBS 139.67 / JCM 10125 / KCTC 9307 / NBRC 14880 / R51) TaxID=469371 RepID=D6Y687_THEBD|nr:hypothetical protein [Thermobispora bispora]ADG89503.1 hypothetical protein Tbis_2804 [Thermobispora bispora DSM 43833]MBO2475308.1 hypothetical protein [Actinomycetales bacterium]MBX6166451.1 hypothetical protein [Thermobispora bispora]MDI9582528.1 hypothetical protein [Thermobispora sp.]
MSEHIEAATAELRPLLEDFILWAPEHAPGGDPTLVGPAVLWHRLVASDDVGRWTRDQLRAVLLEQVPQVVEHRAAAEGMLPALGAYLRFLDATGRLSPGSDPLEALLAELDALEDDFLAAVDAAAPGRGAGADEDEDGYDDEDAGEAGEADDDVGDDDLGEAGSGLGDFEPFADEIAELPAIRLRSDAELAEAARRAPLIAQARDLALWVGTGRKLGEKTLLSDDELADAMRTLGLADPKRLWNLWNLAVDLEFLVPEGEDAVSAGSDVADWPFDDDDDTLDVWMAGLRSIDYGDPELDDEDLTVALSGLTRALLIRLLLAGGSRALPGLRDELGAAAAECDDLGLDAWAAAGDPLAPVLSWLTGYGMVTVEGDPEEGTVTLTPLGTEGLVHLLEDEDIEVDARPAVDVMSALDLLVCSADLPEEEADREFAAWLALRSPAEAAAELLSAAAVDESDALVRVQAASLVGTLGEAAVPAWREALARPSLRPYAVTHLAQLGAEGAPRPTRADTHWLILDMWTIAHELGRTEFLSSLHDIGPVPALLGLLDTIWKVRHPHLERLLEAIAATHEDPRVVKAARRALVRARAGE